MERHDAAVSLLASQVKQFYDRKKQFRIYHGSTNSTRQSQYWPDSMVDTSRLSNVLAVDTEKKLALVEPNVPMDKLVEATMANGLVPPVVMEFPGITAGGGFAGTSGESSSFKYGFFDRTVNAIEMVLANGDIIQATSIENSDIFYGAAASFGTLGVATLLEIQLIDAKPFVELMYFPVTSVEESVRKFEEATADPSTDYLDGILFAKDNGVICVGRLKDKPDVGVRVQRFSRSTDPWFYLHARKLIAKSNKPVTEAIPLVDYLFRYDRGGFWVGAYAFQYFVTPFNRVTRWALDQFMHTRVMYHALHKSGHSKRYIIQDVAVPYEAAGEFVDYLEKSFGHYPLWLCPLRQRGQSEYSPHGLMAQTADPNAPTMLLNFGIWGPGPTRRRAFVDANRELEHKVHELRGQKWLYAHAYYTEQEFWDIYDRKEYDALRAKYHATYLPSVYDKVKVDVAAEEQALKESWKIWVLAKFWKVWPLSGIYGVCHAAIGGDYLKLRGKKKLA
ncbi:hypothetical protein POJ06DRAFT_228551 [Lipomyces tetrasporus]|uniref:Delta(24)-sterol reductase n=1 Tax=Lipomyces tetrasporus TaxID=54092 RepID=A0AAD7QLQ1_9ASCO|nr:uncharacterized protein POJ06DRAFT_228551 [Lipomyces tetrasporus]KAJ8097176.1 hypothetical protein POJ06DRAFT_228551 [Lipomyces tetrasporus]